MTQCSCATTDEISATVVISYLVMAPPMQGPDLVNDIDDLLVDLEEQEGIDLTYDELVPRTAHVIEHRYRDPDGTVCLSVANDSRTHHAHRSGRDTGPDRCLSEDAAARGDLRRSSGSRTRTDGIGSRRIGTDGHGSRGTGSESIALIRQALHSSDDDLTLAAIEAACLTGWLHFLDELVTLHLRHSESETRALAGQAVQALIRASSPG
ncbi:hypothetical protein [Nonomuraea sp. WAC 01424]|uniref:hypothetical protein n=1 Tax=Nonomuraea sp. WAC 01424 TaxID=2203200 RepID=UPI000F7702F8|nr:hypothetical protein [Nonomuraea sp. WAC 01424]